MYYVLNGIHWHALRARTLGGAKNAARRLYGPGAVILGRHVSYGMPEPILQLINGKWQPMACGMDQEIDITIRLTVSADAAIHRDALAQMARDVRLAMPITVHRVQILEIKEEAELYGNR